MIWDELTVNGASREGMVGLVSNPSFTLRRVFGEGGIPSIEYLGEGRERYPP